MSAALALLLRELRPTDVALASFDSPLGTLHLASVAGGVCAVAFEDRLAGLIPRLRRMFGPFYTLGAGDPLDVAPRLAAYFDGALDALHAVPLAVFATPLQQRVFHLVRGLAPGTTTTYAALAARLGMPRAQRAIGVCLAANPVPLLVPCHRVIAASGGLASHPGGVVRKQSLLAHEGAQRALRPSRARRAGALDPGDKVDLVAWPRVAAV